MEVFIYLFLLAVSPLSISQLVSCPRQPVHPLEARTPKSVRWKAKAERNCTQHSRQKITLGRVSYARNL